MRAIWCTVGQLVNMATSAGIMTKVTSLPDNVDFEVAADETLLEAGLRSDIAFAHACGGRAKCSTCRIWVLDGLDTCPERTELETSMANRVGFAKEVRLACQLRPEGRLRIRRLVLDETDLMMCSQLDRAVAVRARRRRSRFFSVILPISRRLRSVCLPTT